MVKIGRYENHIYHSVNVVPSNLNFATARNTYLLLKIKIIWKIA